MSDQDSIFFRNFSLLVGALFLFIIIIAVISGIMNNEVYKKEGPADRSGIQKTIRSVAEVNTDPNAIAAVVAPVSEVAFSGSLDANMIYDNVCMACHTTGAGGAPKLIATEWTGRLDKGIDGLTANAIQGYQGELGIMPAKGGRTDLSDEQVRVTVEYMVDNLN